MSNDYLEKGGILCIYGSPRKGGNTDLLMDAFAKGAEAAGGKVHRVYLRDLKFSPCLELYRCRREGVCGLKDDMTPLYDLMANAHGVALATPVMFYTVSAFTKAFMDRCQSLWCVKYLLKRPVFPERGAKAKGVLLCAGGSAGVKLFDGIRMTFKYFLDAIDGEPFGEVLVRNADKLNDVKKLPETLAEAERLGAELARSIAAGLEGGLAESR